MNDSLDIVWDALSGGIIDAGEAMRATIAIERDYYEKRPKLWFKKMFPHILTAEFNELHDYMMDNMHAPLSALLAPRGHAKTTIQCVCIPIFLAVTRIGNYRFFFNIQSTASKGVSINSSIKSEFENNAELIRLYGDLRSEKWTESHFDLKNGVTFMSAGALMSIRGKLSHMKRPDYIILDDIYDEADMYSAERITKKEEWFWGAVYQMRPHHKKSCIRIQGTAAHRDDLMHKMSASQDFIFRKFQAIINEETKEVLWPDVKPFESLISDRKNMGTYLFNREMQNDCYDYNDSIIKKSWLHEFDFELLPEEIEMTILAVDPATDVDTGDYTGKAIIAKTFAKSKHGVKFFILDLFNDKLTLNDNKAHITALDKKYSFNYVWIESVSAFRFIGQDMARESDVNVSYKELTSVKTSKIARLFEMSPKFENGLVFLSSTIKNDMKQMYFEQMTNPRAAHDDVRDAILMGIKKLVDASKHVDAYKGMAAGMDLENFDEEFEQEYKRMNL